MNRNYDTKKQAFNVAISEEEQMTLGGLLVWLEKTELPKVSIGQKMRWMKHLEDIIQRQPNQKLGG